MNKNYIIVLLICTNLYFYLEANQYHKDLTESKELMGFHENKYTTKDEEIIVILNNEKLAKELLEMSKITDSIDNNDESTYCKIEILKKSIKRTGYLKELSLQYPTYSDYMNFLKQTNQTIISILKTRCNFYNA